MPSRRAALARPTISVLCPTAHRGPLVAAILDDLRAAVDEIIVAADARVAAGDLGHYARIADRLLRYEHAGANRHWPWLAAQASGDWLLLLDGDELPSDALIAALGDLVADRRIRQYSLPIHWSWPDSATRLCDEPWSSDRRLRLVRSHALTFAARKHGLANADGPLAFRDDVPVYHLDLVLPDLARRRAKAARYDIERFGLLTAAGLPFNEAFYVPENASAEPRTAAVPAGDAQRIERALAAQPDSEASLDPASVPVQIDEILAHAPGSALASDAYRASIAVAAALPVFTAQRHDHIVWVHVTNEGTVRFAGGEACEPLIRVGAAWRSIDGEDHGDGGRALLPHPLEPGEHLLMPVAIRAPQHAGPAELAIDLVHEHVRWFDQPLRCRIEVGASVADRLSAATTRFGALLPLDEVLEVRRAVAASDGLVRTGVAGSRPTDPLIAALTEDLAVDGWALDGATIDRLVEVARSQAPATIVEFGSGTSTIVLASLFADASAKRLRVISFDEDLHWAARTRDALRVRGLQHVAVVNHLPLIEHEPRPKGYALTAQATQLLRRNPPELIIVDGPTLDSGASRLGTLDAIAPFVRRQATVLLDDALRDAELSVAREWTRREDLVIHGIRATPKGLLEATLQSRARTARSRRARVRDWVRR